MFDQSTLGFAGSQSCLFTPAEVEQLMRVEFERAKRYRYSVACLVFQVDRLEHLHTVHGFESKMEVLGRMVGLVKQATRAGDLLGYLVEDRLVALFPHTGATAARGLAQRLLKQAREQGFQVGDATIRVTLSIGLAHNEESDDLGFDTLVRVAHEGLAVADGAGGDRCSETDLYALYETGRGGEPEASGEGRDYRSELREMVERDGDLERAVTKLVEEILERATREAHDEVLSQVQGGGDQEQAYQREIDLLRRRVAKLTESLGLTERELGRLQGTGPGEEGVSSIYREVQGLSLEDERAELKKQLMASIFEANLDLQRKREAG